MSSDCVDELEAKGRHLDLWIARGLTLGPVALAFPVTALAVFEFGADRRHSLANAPWIVFPRFVLYWGQRTLRELGSRWR